MHRDTYPALSTSDMQTIGDVSVPISYLTETIHGTEEVSIKHGRKVLILAHASDGNIHPVVECGEGTEETVAAEFLLDKVCCMVIGMEGVTLDEHGIDYLKHTKIDRLFSPDIRPMQRAIKQALNPDNILAPNRRI